MHKFIQKFKDLLESVACNQDNLVLAGTNALKSHGLIVGRESNEIDVVIYSPTEEQMKIINILAPLQAKPPLAPMYNQRSFKFKKDDLYIDFILARGQKTPEDLLYFRSCDMEFKVQNISLNVDAKSSYCVGTNESDRIMGRTKDFIDLQQLKNLNFNLNPEHRKNLR